MKISKFVKGNYFCVSNCVFDLKLKPIEFIVYCYLQKCDNSERGCFPSKKTIAKNCGIAVSSVDKALKKLKKAGIISSRKRYSNGKQISNIYKLHDVEWVVLKAAHYRQLAEETEEMLHSEQDELPF